MGYSHGLNIVEVGEKIRQTSLVVMVAPMSWGRKCGKNLNVDSVPTLIAVHPENDPKGEGLAIAKAWATGGHRWCFGIFFVAEVKSDLMGEQTI